MVIRRTPPRYPRQGPSCLMVFLIGVIAVVVAFFGANAQEVMTVIIPEPTPEPTRSATSYAASAALLQRDGEYLEAIQAYTEAIQRDATRVEFYIPLIELLTLTRQPEDAIEWADRAILLEPDNDQVWAALAASQIAYAQRLSSSGQGTDATLAYASAEQAARRAIAINPQNATAWAYIAGALARPGPEYARRYPEAQEAADMALVIDPNNPIVHRYRASVLEVQGYYTAAMDAYLTAININPNLPELHIGLAYNYFATQNIPLAIRTFEDALAIDPDNADAYDGIGYMYFLIGEYPRAEENLVKAVELDPAMVRGHAHLGAAYFRNQNFEDAIDRLEHAVALYETPNSINAIYFNMLGLAYNYTDPNRLCSDANAIFNRVLEAVPDHPDALEGLRRCHAATLGQ
jgi:tetratricopeptide (TPR) repeat protein